jgi:plasmid stabilization system protein ParE
VKIVWSSEARKELRAIKRFIARDSEYYAARVVASIVERVERASEHPTQGHPVHEYPEQPLREVHEAPYRIIYQPLPDRIQIVTIVHFKKRLQS